MADILKATPLKTEPKSGVPLQHPPSTTHTSNEHLTTATEPPSPSAKPLAEMTRWLADLAKRKMMLEMCEREMPRWKSSVEKVQFSIEFAVTELKRSSQEVSRLTEENRAYQGLAEKKEFELLGMRGDLTWLRAQMGQSSGEDTKVKVISDYHPPLPPPEFDDMEVQQ
jgi:hypothetical protein